MEPKLQKRKSGLLKCFAKTAYEPNTNEILRKRKKTLLLNDKAIKKVIMDLRGGPIRKLFGLSKLKEEDVHRASSILEKDDIIGALDTMLRESIIKVRHARSVAFTMAFETCLTVHDLKKTAAERGITIPKSLPVMWWAEESLVLAKLLKAWRPNWLYSSKKTSSNKAAGGRGR